jgi:hypothetical protein
MQGKHKMPVSKGSKAPAIKTLVIVHRDANFWYSSEWINDSTRDGKEDTCTGRRETSD